jgi:hypothetical protein
MRPSPLVVRAWAALLALLLGLAALPALAQEAPAEPADTPSSPEAGAPDAAAPTATPGVAPGTPVRLVQPRLQIDAPIVPVGVDEEGAMASPPDPDTVAWWSLGADISAEGNVVLAAHVNWDGSLRVFGRLFLAQPGDVFYLTDAAGVEHGYLVTWTRTYDAETAPLEEIFLADAPGHQLTLITCGGRFDRPERQYLDRLVVRAQRIEPAPPTEPPAAPATPSPSPEQGEGADAAPTPSVP